MEKEQVSPKSVKTRYRSRPGRSPEYIRHKRPSNKLSRRPNDIYVNRTSQFGQQLARCHRLLDRSFNELTLHGLGSAIHQAINLALQLQETSSTPLELTVTTSTVHLIDDLEPVDDDTEYQTQTRLNSAIHIHIAKTTLVPDPKS